MQDTELNSAQTGIPTPANQPTDAGEKEDITTWFEWLTDEAEDDETVENASDDDAESDED